MSRLLLAALLTFAQVPVSAAPKNPDTLVYALIGDVDSLDPAWQYDGISHEIQFHLYETLVFYKGSSTEDLIALLSTDVPDLKNGLLSKDGLRYSFPIRKGVFFHDGTPLTPQDARYSVLRFMLTDRASGPSGLLLESILGTKTVLGPDGKPDPAIYLEAERAVRIEGDRLMLRLKKPSAVLLPILAGFCPIVSQAWTSAHGGWDGSQADWTRHVNPAKEAATLFDRANGTGPFKLDRWDKENKQLMLSRHEGYWRKPAKLKRLVFKTVAEAATRRLLLSAGDADAAIWERPNLSMLSGVDGISITDDLPFLEVHNVFIYNFKISAEANSYVGSGKLDGQGIPSDFFADKNVREGLAHAFNYEAYIRDGYRGKGARARGPLPRGILGHNPNQMIRPYDPKKAAEHFRKALGGKLWEKGFYFTIAYMEGRSDRLLACQILKKEVEALNPKFKIDVRGVLWSTYLSHFAAGKFSVANARWALDFADPHNAVEPFLHSAGHYAKRQGYSNPKADALIAKGLSETDPSKRKKIYHELQAIAYEDLPQIYTLDTYNFQVTRSWVKGWMHNPIIPYGYLYGAYKE